MEKPKQGADSRRRFTKEFKLEAVRLLEAGEKPAGQLAIELGVARSQLYKWQEELRRKGAEVAFKGPGALPLNQRSEMAQLKRELRQVKEELEILKKAKAYFAKHKSK